MCCVVGIVNNLATTVWMNSQVWRQAKMKRHVHQVVLDDPTLSKKNFSAKSVIIPFITLSLLSIFFHVPNQSVHPAYQPAASSHVQTTVTTAPTVSTAVSQSTPAQESSDLPSTYSYDPTSGFYYDSSTGLYYDPKTQYHYNSKTGNYCYFDSTQQAYISVDNQGTPLPSSTASSVASTSATSPTTTADTQPKKPSDGSYQKPLNAKKIAKDMERWAKGVNAAKATQKQQLKALIQLERAEVVARETVDQQLQQQQQLPVLSPDSAVTRSGFSLSAALEQDTASEKASLSSHAADVTDIPTSAPLPPGADPDPTHTDWTQLACLLCKRKFQSKEVLVKHQQFSDLHKKNLEKLKTTPPAPPPPSTLQPPQPLSLSEDSQEEAELVYRDRAKERRDKYGTPAIIPGWKKRLEREIDKAKFSKYEQPTVGGLKQDNLGNKMLQAMGWSEGQGLGKANQGIVEPVKARMRQVGAGLGASGSSHGLYSSAGTYRETLRQLTKSRYDSVFQE
jgi:RNA-binding protein 5/10